MSEYFTENAAKTSKALNGQSAKLPKGNEVMAKVAFGHASIKTVSAMAKDDVINLLYIPTGSKIVPHLCRVEVSGAAATTLSISIGDSDDPAKYSAAIDIKAAGGKPFTSTEYAHTPVPVPKSSMVKATITAASAVNADVTLTFWIAYIIS